MVCDYHTPSGMGYPLCYEDCNSPVGLEVQVGYSWNCPGGPAGGADTFGVTTLRVVDVYPSGGLVEVKWRMETTGSSHDFANYKPQGWGYVNASLFAAATAGNGPAFYTRANAPGTKLAFDAEIVQNCSPVGPVSGYPAPLGVGQSGYSGQQPFEYCIPRYTSTRYNYGGEQTIDPIVSCTIPVTSNMQVTTIPQAKGCTPEMTGGTSAGATTAFEPLLPGLVELDSKASGPTYQIEVAKAGCISDKKATGNRWMRLSSEDLEEDAIARLLSGAGGVWSNWQAVADGTGDTCVNPDCCRAVHEERTSRTLEYREAQYKGEVRGLEPGNGVSMYFAIYRRRLDSGELYEHYQTDLHYVVAGPDGVATSLPTNVPSEVGYETFVATCRWAPGPPP